MSVLHGFWRSSASYRVRIAANIKQIDYRLEPVHLRRNGGEHRQDLFLQLNPQGLVPVWSEDDWSLSQSLSIIEYLDEVYQQNPLLPAEPRRRAEVRAFSQLIACDIHPLNNLRVLGYLAAPLEHTEEEVATWYQHWVRLGFDAVEKLLEQSAGQFCFGDELTMADCCLVPQVYNAARFDFPVHDYPLISRINSALNNLKAISDAAPEQQADAE